PDGRLQRLRPAVGRPREVSQEWQLLVEISRRLGLDVPHTTSGQVLGEIGQRVPLYRGISLDEIGAKGVRWSQREEAASAIDALGEVSFSAPSPPPAAPEP